MNSKKTARKSAKRPYVETSKEYAEIFRLRDELAQSRVGAKEKDVEIAALKAEVKFLDAVVGPLRSELQDTKMRLQAADGIVDAARKAAQTPDGTIPVDRIAQLGSEAERSRASAERIGALCNAIHSVRMALGADVSASYEDLAKIAADAFADTRILSVVRSLLFWPAKEHTADVVKSVLHRDLERARRIEELEGRTDAVGAIGDAVGGIGEAGRKPAEIISEARRVLKVPLGFSLVDMAKARMAAKMAKDEEIEALKAEVAACQENQQQNQTLAAEALGELGRVREALGVKAGETDSTVARRLVHRDLLKKEVDAIGRLVGAGNDVTVLRAVREKMEKYEEAIKNANDSRTAWANKRLDVIRSALKVLDARDGELLVEAAKRVVAEREAARRAHDEAIALIQTINVALGGTALGEHVLTVAKRVFAEREDARRQASRLRDSGAKAAERFDRLRDILGACTETPEEAAKRVVVERDNALLTARQKGEQVVALEQKVTALEQKVTALKGQLNVQYGAFRDSSLYVYAKENHSKPATPSEKSEPKAVSLNDLARQYHENSKAHGFWEQEVEYDAYSGKIARGMKEIAMRRLPEKLVLIHSELSEALEVFRELPKGQDIAMSGLDYSKCLLDEASGARFPKPVGFDSEMADVLIRTMELCCALGIDIDRAMQEKHRYNCLRPLKHGGKAI